MIKRIRFSIGTEALKEILKETIVLNRIKCANLIQGVLEYLIENDKHLYIVMNFYKPVRIKNLNYNYILSLLNTILLIEKFLKGN